MRTNALSEAVSRSFGPSTIVLRVLLHEITPPQRHLLYENSFLSFSSINLHGFRSKHRAVTVKTSLFFLSIMLTERLACAASSMNLFDWRICE